MKKTELSDYFRRMGKKGGAARAAKLSGPRRSEIARKAGQAKRKNANTNNPAE